MEKVKKISSIFFPISTMFVIVTSILYYDKFTEMPVLFIFNFIQMLLWGHFFGVVNLGKNLFKKAEEETELRKNIFREKQESLIIEKKISYEDYVNQLKKQNECDVFGENCFLILSKYIEMIVGVSYKKNSKNTFSPISKYAFPEDFEIQEFRDEDGFCGQATKNKKVLIISEIPEDYTSSFSGLGNGKPKTIVFIPLLRGNKVDGLFEIALFKLKKEYIDFFEKLSENLITDLKNLEFER